MSLTGDRIVDWPEPWEAVGDNAELADYRRGWEEELLCEIGPEHCLFGLEIKLIARRYDSDDALFQLEDGRVAEVHLTWARRQEHDAKWPATHLCSSLAEWMRAVSGTGGEYA